MKKIVSILLTIVLIIDMLIVLTACENKEKAKTSRKAAIASSEDVINSYFNAINKRNFNSISELYNIKGMNEYSKRFIESEFDVTENILKSTWDQYFEVLEKFKVSLAVKGIYKLTDRASIEEMYERINEDLVESEQFAGQDADSTWDALKDTIQDYNLYYVRLTRVDKDEQKETSTLLILDDHGKIINDSAMYYVLYSYAYKK